MPENQEAGQELHAKGLLSFPQIHLLPDHSPIQVFKEMTPDDAPGAAAMLGAHDLFIYFTAEVILTRSIFVR